jgi:hypothetical protein
MNVKTRQTIERRIIRRIVTDAIGAGHFVSVHDGEETTVARSRDVRAIMAAIMTTDDDVLLFSASPTEKAFGWVRLIYGNSGYDVVNDYTTNLEPIMAGATALADKLEEQYS